jgi:hypothetical protein
VSSIYREDLLLLLLLREAVVPSPNNQGGRESPENDPSGRTGVSRSDLTAGMVQQTQIDCILATVPAVSTPLARSAPPARCPEPTRALPAIYHSSAPRLPPPRAPTSTSPLFPTSTYQAVSWYTPSTRTRVPVLWADLPLIKLVLLSQNKWGFQICFVAHSHPPRSCSPLRRSDPTTAISSTYASPVRAARRVRALPQAVIIKRPATLVTTLKL